MSRKTVTQEYLAKKVWWWRDGAEKHPVAFGPNYAPIKTYCESRLAFHYELLRRVCRKRRLAPFTSLNYGHLNIISGLADEKLPPPISRDNVVMERLNEVGWTRHGVQWNLECSQRSLVRAFKDFIQAERTRQQVSRPIPNKGKKNRPFSWRWPELMDSANLTAQILDESERGSLSQARRLAKQKLKQFDKAIAEYWEPSDPLSSLAHDHKDADDALEEWFEQFPPVICPQRLWKNIWPQE